MSQWRLHKSLALSLHNIGSGPASLPGRDCSAKPTTLVIKAALQAVLTKPKSPAASDAIDVVEEEEHAAIAVAIGEADDVVDAVTVGEGEAVVKPADAEHAAESSSGWSESSECDFSDVEPGDLNI